MALGTDKSDDGDIKTSAVTRGFVVVLDMLSVTGVKNGLSGRFPDNNCLPGVSSGAEL